MSYHDHTDPLQSAAASSFPLKDVTWFDVQARSNLKIVRAADANLF